MDSSKARMIKERTLLATKAWSLGKAFFTNKYIDKKIRIKCFDASIRPILQYGLATQNLTKNETRIIQSTLSKYLRKIEEREMWNEAKKNNDFTNIKRLTNAKLRKKWNLASIDSLLFKEKAKFYARSKLTSAPAYLTFKKEMDEFLNTISIRLQSLKDDAKHYKGFHLNEKIKKLRSKCEPNLINAIDEIANRSENAEPNTAPNRPIRPANKNLYNAQINNSRIRAIVDKKLQNAQNRCENALKLNKKQKEIINSSKQSKKLIKFMELKRALYAQQPQGSNQPANQHANEQEIRANEIVESIPIENNKREYLINGLLKTDIQKSRTGKLLKYFDLLSNIDNDDDYIPTDSKKAEIITCNICKQPFKGKTMLTKHLSNPHFSKCKAWHDKCNAAIKFCDNNNCDYTYIRPNELKRHRELECDGEHHDYHKLPKVDLRRNPSKSTNMIYEENHIKCSKCSVKVPKTQLKRMLSHIAAKHKRPIDQLNEHELETRSKKRKIDNENRNKQRAENTNFLKKTTSKGDDIPKCLQPELHMKRINERYEDENLFWQCTKCPYVSNNTIAIVRHIGQIHGIHASGKNITKSISDESIHACPYCQRKYKEYARLKTHLFYQRCDKLGTDIENTDGDKIWSDIKNYNSLLAT